MMKKQNSRFGRGFTLAETLVAVLILLMVSAVVASGIPTAKNAYEKVVLSSNAQVFLSTTVTVLRNELGTAQNVEVEDGAITYFSSARGTWSRIGIVDNEIKILRYLDKDGLGVQQSPEPEPLVSDKAGPDGLKASYAPGQLRYNNGLITFGSLSVKKGAAELASLPTLSIRVIAG